MVRLVPLFAVLYSLEIIVVFLISTSGVNNSMLDAEAQHLQVLRSLGFYSLLTYIFANNLRVATLELIPILGIIFYLVAIVNTSQVISSIIVQSGLGYYPLYRLFSVPDTWIELSAYIIALIINLYILIALYQLIGSNKRKAISYAKTAMALYGFTALVLFAAALFETLDIRYPLQLFNSFDIYWIPAAGAIIILSLLLKGILGHLLYTA